VSREFDICAIDAGQTRVRYLIFHAGKTMLSGQTDQGITNILLPEALTTLKHHITSMLEQFRETFGQYRFRVVSIGCTGIAKEREEFSIVLNEFTNAFPETTVILESDILVSHIANFEDKPGIILHAGTGAFAFGKDQHGNSMRTGGWGYLLGDEGAGFWLGLSGIRAALQALEQTGPDTSLKGALLPYFGIHHLTRLKTIVYKANFQHRIANFSTILFEHAEQDDPVAVQIVNEGAKQMVRLVDPLLKQLDFDHATIALTGALYTNVSAYYHLCKLLLKEQYTETVHVKLGENSILDGAIWLGKKFLEGNT
jgi:N-acetylglucosamine kinase-like BadF-type ATPase